MSSRPPSSASSPSSFPRGNIFFWVYLLVLVVLLGTTMNPADADLWHRFALYDYLVRTGHFPAGDVFSYQATAQVVPDHEWGSAFIFYPVYFWGGGSCLVILKLVMLAATVALTAGAGLGRRAPTMLEMFFYSVVLIALLPSFLSTLRSEVFTHAFFALWIFWFQRERRGHPTPAPLYLLTFVIWENLHPGFVLGLIWLAALTTIEFFTGKEWRPRALLLALCLAATLINPFGYELWVGIFRAFAVSRSAFEEWGPVPWIHPAGTFSGYKILLLWMIPTVCAHVHQRGWKRCDRTAVILLGLFLVPSLLEARQASIFSVLAGGLLPPLFLAETPLQEIRAWKPWLHRVVVRGILVLLPIIYAIRLFPSNEGFHLVYLPDNCPIKAVDYLRQSGVTGRLLVGFNPGSYALWELRGKMRVSMDGRYDLVYPPDAFANVEHFFAGDPQWQDALSALAPDAILVSLPDGVYPKLRADPDWIEVYQAEGQAVFLPRRKGA